MPGPDKENLVPARSQFTSYRQRRYDVSARAAARHEEGGGRRVCLLAGHLRYVDRLP
jgi:hypothetical protein